MRDAQIRAPLACCLADRQTFGAQADDLDLARGKTDVGKAYKLPALNEKDSHGNYKWVLQ